jgi:hypothetical protein
MRAHHLVAAPLIAVPLVAIAAGLAPQQSSFNFLQPPTPQLRPPLLMPEAQMPAISLVGPNSSIHQRRFERIRDENAWQALWELHAKDAGPRAAQGWLLQPRIDFKNYEVIAFFRGDSTNHNGEVVQTVLTEGSFVVLRFDSITYQTASPLNAPDVSGGVPCTPYGIWVIPRSSKPVVLEENVQGLKDKPAQWELQHHFPGQPDDGC